MTLVIFKFTAFAFLVTLTFLQAALTLISSGGISLIDSLAGFFPLGKVQTPFWWEFPICRWLYQLQKTKNNHILIIRVCDINITNKCHLMVENYRPPSPPDPRSLIKEKKYIPELLSLLNIVEPIITSPYPIRCH